MNESNGRTACKTAMKALRIATGLTYTGTRQAAEYAGTKVSDWKRRFESPSEDNWYLYAADSCEGVCDAILNNKAGTSERIVRTAAGKLGMIGVPAAIFSTATLIGTASTGTAIGSLSGAAFTSAALAWVGGSVVLGSVIVGVAAVAGGIGAVFGVGRLAKTYVFGKLRMKADLDEQERRIVDASLALALAFRNEEKAGRKIDSIAAKALYDDALKPLCDELLEHRIATASWPYVARERLRKAVDRLQTLTSFTGRFTKEHPNLTTGIVGAVITQLLADDIPEFDANEQLVLDAMRRANNSLTTATDEELAAHVQALEPVQLQGLSNLLIGISHELRYYVEENSDSDQYVVELFAATNHPGSDVRITNTLTGEVEDVQLKASNYASYIEQHNERYANIRVLATDEAAAANDAIGSTGIAHEELAGDVGTVMEGLGDFDAPGVLSSMSVAGMLALARNVRVMLKGEGVSEEAKRRLVREGSRSAIVAGLVHTIIC